MPKTKKAAKGETPSEHKKKHSKKTAELVEELSEKEQKEKEEAFMEMLKKEAAPSDEEVPQGDEPGHGEECEHCRRYG
jgi:mannose/cellobiose epimerase-like protein (N-acyl-D-glucosamine 2-epimerase family)